MFRDTDDVRTQFLVEGPYGKGLNISKVGTYIAFAAGTGILPFLDLVAYIIQNNRRKLRKPLLGSILHKDFKFILYASFSCEKEGIGINLCKGL